MGQIQPQQLQKLKSQRLDLDQLQDYLSKVKTDDDIETAIKQLISLMTLKQKIGQLQQISYGDQQVSAEMQKIIVNGAVGSFLNVWKLQTVNKMQKISMEQSRLKIPLLIGKDVIHGYRTVFPIPLAQAASFNPELAYKGSRVAAIQCSSMGIKWTFTPMVDIARDPRWGRIAQGFGQDPYLASVMGVAVSNGFQTDNLKDITSVAACGKHFVGYGATEGGRDYNTTLIPQNTLRDIYLTPFEALCKSGCLTYMSAFNDLNGQPASSNQFTLKKVLRNQWGFKGLVVSDYNAVLETLNHGFAQNSYDAAKRSFNAGLDMEMVSTCFYDNIETLLSKGQITLTDLQTKVANCLRVKFKLDLFKNYYTDPTRQTVILSAEHKAAAKAQALQCPVLLQNNNKVLPISTTIGSLAVIGALGDDPENQIGCWAGDGKASDSITPLTSLKAALTSTKVTFAKGYKSATSTDVSLIDEAVQVASQADKIVLFIGENNDLSGQSHSRAYIDLPGIQLQLVKALSALKKPIVAVVYAGRSLLLQPILTLVDSVLYAWHLGTMAGPALSDLLLGVVSPSGKLPLTFLRAQGQIPLYYNKKNTGRPNQTHNYQPFTSSYIDIDSTPLFPYGFGLSYSSFTYSTLKLSATTIKMNETLTITAIIKNDGAYKAEETVFLFVRDLVGSYTRPVKELKDFKRVSLISGEIKGVTFTLDAGKLKFWTRDQETKAELGKFNVWVGKNAQEGLQGTFELVASSQEEEEKFEKL